MTPSYDDPMGSERGAISEANAQHAHGQSGKTKAEGVSPSAPNIGLVPPPPHKKRARRRHRGKGVGRGAGAPQMLNAGAPQALNAGVPHALNLEPPVDDAPRPAPSKKRRRRNKTATVSAALLQPALSAPYQADKNRKKDVGPKSRSYETSKTGDAPFKDAYPKDVHIKEGYTYQRGALYAALDLGTNNCRLLIATPTKPGFFRVVDAFSRIVRLGEGLGHCGVLQQEAMDRAIEALKICRDKISHRTIRAHRLIATEACRTAANGADFIKRVKQEVGLDLEIIDRETEARLAVSGCGTLVDRGTEAIVLFDIGGGSSEIALIDVSQRRSPRLAEHITAWTSLPVGVVTLAEQYGGETVDMESFERMKAHVRGLLAQFADRYKLGALAKSPHFHLLGTSGTVTTLAGLHLDLERYDRRRIDGIWLENDDVTKMTERLLSWDIKKRIANPCIGQDRADLVLAGCAILEAIREVWPSPRLRVADRGLREGILTELMSRDGAWRRRRRGTHHHGQKRAQQT